MRSEEIDGVEADSWMQTVLPAVKAGKALWVDNSSGDSPSPLAEEVVTPLSQDIDMGEYESEEEEAVPISTRAKPTRARK